jgi:acyl-CoA thioester hydrolase
MKNWFSTKVDVRYQETDQMGVVYHSNYFVWFEIARTEMIKHIGITYKEMEATGLLMPVVDVNCQYHVPAQYDDELIIRVAISKHTGVRTNFCYQVIRAKDGVLLAEGETKHVYIDEDFKLKRLDRTLPEYYEKILKIYNEQK